MEVRGLGEMNEEKSLGDTALGEKEFSFPMWLRLLLLSIFAIFLAISLALLVSYLLNPSTSVRPNEIGVSDLIIFCLLGIIIFLIPLENYGLRIKKFGPFEFEQILSTQAAEHVKELNEIRERIQKLEDGGTSAKITATDSEMHEAAKEKSTARDHSKKLQERLHTFLTEYRRWAFSPARIANWGSKQEGFADLSRDPDEIRNALQAMVSKGDLVTRISQKGNTLYRVPL